LHSAKLHVAFDVGRTVVFKEIQSQKRENTISI